MGCEEKGGGCRWICGVFCGVAQHFFERVGMECVCDTFVSLATGYFVVYIDPILLE